MKNQTKFSISCFLVFAYIIMACDNEKENITKPETEVIEEIDVDLGEEEEMGDGNESENPDNEEETDIDGSSFIDNEDFVLEENLIIDKERKFVTNILEEEIYNQYVYRELNVRDITKKVYEHLDDDYDLIVILATEVEHPSGEPSGFNSSAKNDVEGLGSNTFDSTTAFGSKGKLKATVFMPRTESIARGPFLHEIAHVWGNKGFIPTTVSGHWGYSSAAGQLGGWDTVTNLGNNTYKGTENSGVFGTFANGGNGLPYSNLELYLMGLIPESELESIQVAVNPESTENPGEFTADEIRTYTREELIEINGPRVPSVENSQKEFNVLTVILAPEVLSEKKKESINDYLNDFFAKETPSITSYNFWTATGERASMIHEISESSILQ